MSIVKPITKNNPLVNFNVKKPVVYAKKNIAYSVNSSTLTAKSNDSSDSLEIANFAKNTKTVSIEKTGLAEVLEYDYQTVSSQTIKKPTDEKISTELKDERSVTTVKGRGHRSSKGVDSKSRKRTSSKRHRKPIKDKGLTAGVLTCALDIIEQVMMNKTAEYFGIIDEAQNPNFGQIDTKKPVNIFNRISSNAKLTESTPRKIRNVNVELLNDSVGEMTLNTFGKNTPSSIGFRKVERINEQELQEKENQLKNALDEIDAKNKEIDNKANLLKEKTTESRKNKTELNKKEAELKKISEQLAEALDNLNENKDL